MTAIRVLVVDDSATVRGRLCDALATGGFEVVGQADDGQKAIDLCEKLRPDVITMDMMLPGLTGLDATEHIMAKFPTPILVVSASTNRGELFRTYEALAAGAVDVLEKPRADEAEEAWDDTFRSTLRMVSRIRVITHPRLNLRQLARAGAGLARSVAASTGQKKPVQRAFPSLVAIGASTGGPSALLRVLGAIPKDSPLPVLVVIHIGGPFGSAFAEWLDQQVPLRVAWARDGAPFEPGCAVIAPPSTHLVVREGRTFLTTGPERHSCRPSVDVLFESIAADCGSSALAALLTGMGRDGAAGLLALRRAGAATIAQDEASSVVWGMPREAVQLGAAERVLPLDEIGPAIASLSMVRR